MGVTVDIGRRIELISMDPHFHDITIALYVQSLEKGPAFLVHTYSQLRGAEKRVRFIAEAMCTLGGLKLTSDGLIHFPCWSAHEAACRRIFVEACKLTPSAAPGIRPLSILDKKSGLTITAPRGSEHTGCTHWQETETFQGEGTPWKSNTASPRGSTIFRFITSCPSVPMRQP